jgi:hypothetical protein
MKLPISRYGDAFPKRHISERTKCNRDTAHDQHIKMNEGVYFINVMESSTRVPSFDNQVPVIRITRVVLTFQAGGSSILFDSGHLKHLDRELHYTGV